METPNTDNPQAAVGLGSTASLGSFALFSQFAYYPHGGMWDYVGCYHTKEEAHAEAMRLKKDSDHDWYHIVDRNTMRVVEAEGYSCYASPDSLLPNFLLSEPLASAAKTDGPGDLP